MAHAIWQNRFASRTKPAWHGLGTQFETPLTASQASHLAGLNYDVTKLPLRTLTPDGTSIEIPDQYAITRMAQGDDPYKVFGIVGRDYEVISNQRIAEILDPLTEQFPVETCGALHEGAKVFYSLRAAQSSDVAGEEIINYFVVSDGKDGLQKLRVMYTPVRVVCQNTLTAATAQASVNIELNHRQDAATDLEFYSRLTLEFLAAQEMTLDRFRSMTKRAVSTDDIATVIASAFREPALPRRVTLANEYDLQRMVEAGILGAQQQWDRAQDSRRDYELAYDRVNACRQLAVQAMARFNDEHTALAGTAWALYNACTETSDWRKGRGGVAESVLFGERAQEKSRAYSAIMKL